MRVTSHPLAALAAISTLALALTYAPGWAHADRYDLSMGPLTRVTQSSSVDALTEDGMSLFSLIGAVAIDRVRVPFFDRVYIEGVFEAGGAEASAFQTLETSTSVYSWAVGARLSRGVSDRLTVQARADLGLSRIDVSLWDRFMSRSTLGDAGYTGTAYVGAASDYVLARSRRAGVDRFSLGVRAELGYLAALPKTLRAQPMNMDREEGAILIPEQAADLGAVDLSAVSVRFGVVGRF